MSKKPSFPDVPETAAEVDDGATYAIRVSAPVPVGRRMLAVSLPHQVSGRFLKSIFEKVSDVRKITG